MESRERTQCRTESGVSERPQASAGTADCLSAQRVHNSGRKTCCHKGAEGYGLARVRVRTALVDSQAEAGADAELAVVDDPGPACSLVGNGVSPFI
jgi:hypothetical protein